MRKPAIDEYARRIFQKYGLHPNGWSLRQDAATQEISGTPSVTPPANDPLTITTGGYADGVLNVLYTEVDSTAIGGLPPYVWGITSGAVPSGLNFAADGKLTGTPDIPYLDGVQFTVRVTDAALAFTEQTYHLFVME